LHFGTDITRADVSVDQSLDPVMRPATARSATMSFNLAEMSPAKIQLASGQGTLTTTAPISGVKGHNDLAIGSLITDVFVSIGFDIQTQDLQAFRIIGYRCQMSGSMPSTSPLTRRRWSRSKRRCCPIPRSHRRAWRRSAMSCPPCRKGVADAGRHLPNQPALVGAG
jgi:hypothetical protein